MRRRARATKRLGLIAAASGALVAAALACSSSPSAGTSEDAGPGPTDASGQDAPLGIELDAFPTTFPEASPSGADGNVDSGGDAAPVTLPEAAPTCSPPAPSDPCGLDPQCGCAVGQTCDINDDSTQCVVAGSAAVGHACVTTASCAPGLTCLDGACRPFCGSSGDAGCDAKLAEGGVCEAVVGDDGGPIPGFGVCAFNCQLQDPNACGPTGDLNAGCIPNGAGTDCTSMGLTGIGGACTYLNDCLPGLVCTGTCLQWCRVGHSPSDCGDGEACQAFATAVTANGIEYGYCP